MADTTVNNRMNSEINATGAKNSRGVDYWQYRGRQESSASDQALEREWEIRFKLQAQFGEKSKELERHLNNFREKNQAELLRKEALERSKLIVESNRAQLRALQQRAAEEKRNNGKISAATKKALEEQQKLYKDSVKSQGKQKIEDIKEQDKESRAEVKENWVTDLKSVFVDGNKAQKQALEGLQKTMSALTNKVGNYIDVFNSYSAGISTRLQGTGRDYKAVTKTLTKQLAVSPWVKQTDVLETISKMVDQGVGYNVEQRAFLETMSDKLVTSFEANTGSLLRIIRLQQADSTIARMGMESLLNKFMNSSFQDTTYLTDSYDTVQEALIEAISQLGRDQGLQFEYVAQKWLGSMYSTGLSSQTVNSLAEGINYLATGDVEGLAGNESIQNLFVTAATRAGLPYGEMLSKGVSSENLNDLLEEIVKFGQTLSKQDNLVVKQSYAKIYGLTLSDMTALAQLGEDLGYITESIVDYGQAVAETKSQLSSVGSRMATSEIINNVFENVMSTTAKGIAENPALYVTWMVTDIVEQMTGGISIPSIMAFGTGIDLNTTVTQLMKNILFGGALLGQIGTIVSSMANGGGLNLDYAAWSADEYTKRGSGFAGISAGVSKTTSFTASVGNSGGDDISDSITAQETAETKEVAGQDEEAKKSEEQMKDIQDNVNTIADILSAVFSGNALRVTVEDYGLVNYTSQSNLGGR